MEDPVMKILAQAERAERRHAAFFLRGHWRRAHSAFFCAHGRHRVRPG